MCRKESRVVEVDLKRPRLCSLFFKDKIKSHTWEVYTISILSAHQSWEDTATGTVQIWCDLFVFFIIEINASVRLLPIKSQLM